MRSGKFSKAAFVAASDSQRSMLCAELAAALTEQIRASRTLHDGAMTAIRELREQGHDLWSFDEDDDFEIWCPSYAKPSGPGIIISFRACTPTEVQWWDPASIGPRSSHPRRDTHEGSTFLSRTPGWEITVTEESAAHVVVRGRSATGAEISLSGSDADLDRLIEEAEAYAASHPVS